MAWRSRRSAPSAWAPSTSVSTRRSRASRQSRSAGSATPDTLDTWLKASTRVRSESAARNGATSSSAEAGAGGVPTRLTANPYRSARTSHATSLVGWFWSQITTSSPGPSSSPETTVLLASLVFRTMAISSASAPTQSASSARVSSRSSPNAARFWNDASASMDRVCAVTASITGYGDGHRFAAFMITSPGRSGNCSRTSAQYASSAGAPVRPASISKGRVGRPARATRGTAAVATTPPRTCRKSRRVRMAFDPVSSGLRTASRKLRRTGRSGEVLPRCRRSSLFHMGVLSLPAHDRTARRRGATGSSVGWG